MLLSIGLLLGGCQNWWTARQEPLPSDPTTPVGTALLFKKLLDSGSTADATCLLAASRGKPLLAEQRYELLPELERLRSLVGGLPITYCRTDSSAPFRSVVWLELDYLYTLRFTLDRRDSLWFITALEFIPWHRPAVPLFPDPAE